MEAAVERAKRLLRPGGVLLIIDLFENDELSDFFLSGVALSLGFVSGRWLKRTRQLRAAWNEHGRGDSYFTLAEARRLCWEFLPGSTFKRHLFWRYSVVWHKGLAAR